MQTSSIRKIFSDTNEITRLGALSMNDQDSFHDALEEAKDGQDPNSETRSVASSMNKTSSTMRGTTLADDHFLVELWRIFTFYGLHTDPTQPEVMRIPSFVRFARDVQMLTPRFTSTMVELEIVRLARDKRIAEYGGKEISGEGYTIALSFADFLALLEIMAPKVYPLAVPEGEEEEVNKVQVRRLLLENVLLLANRREKMSFNASTAATMSQFPRGTKPPPAPEDVIALYRTSIGNIFRYYAEKANKRRSSELSAEAVKKGMAGSSRRLRGNEASKRHADNTREHLHAMRFDLIGYPEYMQFCADFSLRSTSLLTAIQVGELYLQVVPLDAEHKRLRQMNEPMFHTLLVNMALLAYRNSHLSVLPHNKVKALLNYMWRAVNCSERVDRLALARKGVSSSHAGSLNMYGSGAFSDFYLAQWIGEPTGDDLREREPDKYREMLLTGHLYPKSMPDYTAAIEEPPVDAQRRLAKIVREQKEVTNQLRNQAAADGAKKNPTADGALPPPPTAVSLSSQTIVLHDFQLAALFRLRPEIGELIYLEIRNMYLEMAAKQAQTK